MIGILFCSTLAPYGFTGSALFAVQTEKIEWFDLTTTGALASFCRGSFKGHAGVFTHSTPSNQNAVLRFFHRSLPPRVQGLVLPRGLQERLQLLGLVLISPARGWLDQGLRWPDAGLLLCSAACLLHWGQSPLRLECM